MNPNDNSGWNEWSKHVLIELERLNASYEKMDDRLDELNTKIAVMQAKAGMFGAIAGLGGGSAIAAAFKYLGLS